MCKIFHGIDPDFNFPCITHGRLIDVFTDGISMVFMNEWRMKEKEKDEGKGKGFGSEWREREELCGDRKGCVAWLRNSCATSLLDLV